MIAFRFGAARRELFAALHPSESRPARASAVLLCAPFGQEAHQSHRLLRVLADRLARGGHSALRFEPYGSGDSDGDDAELNLEGWCEDLLAAGRELMRRTGATQVAWLGVGLGASVACIASRRATPAVARLVLWDPVLDGRAYLERLRARHVHYLEHDLARPWAAMAAARGVAADGPRDEALGFPLPAPLRSAIESLALEAPVAGSLVVVATREDPALAPTLAAWGASAPQWERAVEGEGWDSDAAMNSAVLPAPLLARLHTTLVDLP